MSGSWPGLTGDHHVHSTWSDDARSTLQENIAAAEAVGLTELRLVDHVRQSTTWVPEFVAAAAAAVAGQVDGTFLTIRTGVEAKILDSTGRLDLPAGVGAASSGIDRILIADHQYPGPDGPMSPSKVLAERAAGLRADTIVDTLVLATIRAVQSVERAQLAHPFSLLPKVGLTEDDLDDDHLMELAGAAAAADCWVEINEKWDCPGSRVIEKMHEAGVTLVASTDSHLCTDIGRYPRIAARTAGLVGRSRAQSVGGGRVR